MKNTVHPVSPLTRLQPQRHAPLVLVLLAALAADGCSLLNNTPFVAPQAPLPAQFAHRTKPDAEAAKPVVDAWWREFGDAQLDGFVDQVFAHNADLASAGIKLRRAAANAGLDEHALWPTPSATLASTSSRQLKEPHQTTHDHSVTLGLGWEVDLWNKLGAARDASAWELQASSEDRDETALTLSGSAAQLYWQAAYLQQRLALSAQSVAYAEQTLQLAQAKLAAGAASELDELEAEQSLETQKAAHTLLLQQAVENRNAIDLLLDGSQLAAALPARLPDGALPVVAAGLPADLLARRPDVRAAELRVREALATVDASRAAFYPDLTLTGSLGGSSDRLRDVLTSPFAALASQLTLPFLDWKTHQLNLEVSQADFDLTVVDFRQTLYGALQDVDNALSARLQYARQGESLERAMRAAQKVEAMYEIRYRAGASTLQDWLDAQEKRRSAEVSWAENRYNRLVNHATLCLALGGRVATPAAP
jgi:NodT family efflux transporter outer membrane factor (OMF) lipoprotein